MDGRVAGCEDKTAEEAAGKGGCRERGKKDGGLKERVNPSERHKECLMTDKKPGFCKSDGSSAEAVSCLM